MATILDIIKGLNQAAANAYDGYQNMDEEIGLRREEGHPIIDSRVMDGFSVNGNIAEGQRWWTDYLNRFNHKQRDHFREEWTLESAVRMSGLSVRLAQRLTDSDSMPQMKTDSPIAKTRNHPVEPYFFAQDRMER